MPRPGAAAAVDLCGEAHAVLGRRDADARTWDHASRELAMAYLCLGVERRCVLAGRIGVSHAWPRSPRSRWEQGTLADNMGWVGGGQHPAPVTFSLGYLVSEVF